MRRRGWWAAAGLLAAGVACAAACCSPGSAGRFPGASLVMISLDTTRADHLGCYGRREAGTPRIDALAHRGVLFLDVTTAAPTTLASHTSIMTGLYPHTHGVPENGWVVGEVNTLLAEILAGAGYETAGVVGSYALSRRFGIAQGFGTWDERFDLLLHPRERDQNQRRAAAVTDAALGVLDRLGKGPFFLFVHYFDPHAPYDPPAPFGGREGEDAPDLDDLRRVVAAHQARIAPGEPPGLQVVFHGLTGALLQGADGRAGEEDRRLGDLYSGEIAYMDSEIGRLLSGLDSRGLLQDAVVVVVGDHGETLWEHGDFYNHGLALYQTTVRVPLVIRLPRDEGAGRVVETPVSTVDILPTLLSLLDLQPPRRLEGTSLQPLVEGGSLERGPVYSEATQPADSRFDDPDLPWRNTTRARAVREGRWKLVRTPYLDRWEMFDLASDPEERIDLLAGGGPAGPEPEEALSRMRALLEEWSRSANPLPSFPSRRHLEEVRERLKALGYL